MHNERTVQWVMPVYFSAKTRVRVCTFTKGFSRLSSGCRFVRLAGYKRIRGGARAGWTGSRRRAARRELGRRLNDLTENRWQLDHVLATAFALSNDAPSLEPPALSGRHTAYTHKCHPLKMPSELVALCLTFRYLPIPHCHGLKFWHRANNNDPRGPSSAFIRPPSVTCVGY